MDKSVDHHERSIEFSTSDTRGVGYVYYHCMLKHKDRIAQIDSNTLKEESFGSLLKRCVRTAITMIKKGIKPGDFISSCTLNDLDTCVPYVASFFTGAIMAPVDPTLSVKEIIFLLKQVSPKIIFVSENALSLIEKAVQELEHKTIIVVYGKTKTHTPFAEFLSIYPNEDDFKPRNAQNMEETVLVLFGSGSSGTLKGICHTHRSILSYNPSLEKHEKLILGAVTPIYWIIFHLYFCLSVIHGHTRLVFSAFDYNDPWKLFNHKVNLIFLCPIQTFMFFKHEKPKNLDLANLESIRIGGHRSSRDSVLQLRTHLPKTNIHPVYGQTEIFSTVFAFPSSSHGSQLSQKYPDSVGLPIPGFSYKVVNVETEEILDTNQIGELRLKTKSACKGYYNYDSNELFDKDGWLKTGDLAYYNEENCYFITDRIKESFKYLGYQICPIEIEEVLLSHPSVKNAAVIGLPHETDVSHAMAIVELCSEAEVTPDEIIKYVDEKVEDTKRLRGGVKFIKQFPVTATAKINKNKLRKMIENHEI